ncbi:MAG: YbaB/EbfC family nucleoid-associated protein [Clostridiales bacterium]|nr:YbaB/EbfC family nucleoid-associated protein [Clostridiales bacterium]
MAFNRGGMNNMQGLMKQAQKMQEQMQEADAELEELEVVGVSGGGEEGDETVVVYMNGKKIINGIEFGSKIAEMVDLSDQDDVEMLEDLIMAAINDGYKKADEVYNKKMAPFGNMGGLGGLL